MVYNYKTGIKRDKSYKVEAIVAAAATAVIMAFATFSMTFAAHIPPTVSDNANSNACFGQARASYAQGGPNGMLAPDSNGTYISERKSTNPANNEAYRNSNC